MTYQDYNDAVFSKEIAIKSEVVKLSLAGQENNPMYDFLFGIEMAQIQPSSDEYKRQRRLFNFEHNPALCMKCWTTYIAPWGLQKAPMSCGEWRICPVCQEVRVDKEMKFLQGFENIYSMWIDPEEWQTLYKYIQRHDTKYSRLPQPEDSVLIYLNSDLNGRAELCDIEQIDMKDILSNVPLFENISHSRDKEKEASGPVEEKTEEEKIISLGVIVHKRYEQRDSENAFARAMVENGKEVETTEELEKVLNNVLVTYSNILGNILSTQSKKLAVTDKSITQWNKIMSDYSLNTEQLRKQSDRDVRLKQTVIAPAVPV